MSYFPGIPSTGSGGSRISPRRGRQLPGGGAPTYDFVNFCRKLHENEEILAARGGGRPLRPPLRSATVRVDIKHFTYLTYQVQGVYKPSYFCQRLRKVFNEYFNVSVVYMLPANLNLAQARMCDTDYSQWQNELNSKPKLGFYAKINVGLKPWTKTVYYIL